MKTHTSELGGEVGMSKRWKIILAAHWSMMGWYLLVLGIITIAILFVIGTVHLLQALTDPENIGHFIKSIKEASK